jgi:MerR family copper efflux transcriptional regulator
MDERMRIGELAERAEVTPRTVRYYESLGLLPRGEREGGGQHYYRAEMVMRLRKIEQLKKLGLSLEEVGGVIDLYFTDPSGLRAKHKVLVMLRAHLAEVDQKVGELQQARDELQAHIARFEQWLESQKKG